MESFSSPPPPQKKTKNTYTLYIKNLEIITVLCQNHLNPLPHPLPYKFSEKLDFSNSKNLLINGSRDLIIHKHHCNYKGKLHVLKTVDVINFQLSFADFPPAFLLFNLARAVTKN